MSFAVWVGGRSQVVQSWQPCNLGGRCRAGAGGEVERNGGIRVRRGFLDLMEDEVGWSVKRSDNGEFRTWIRFGGVVFIRVIVAV